MIRLNGLSHADRRGRSDAIRDILAAAAAPGVLSMAGGLPAPDSFPVTELMTVLEEVMSSAAAAALQYGPVEGTPAMRMVLADRAGETGSRADPARVIVTSGSHQGLALTANVLLAPGDRVALADPSYLGAVQLFQRAGAELADTLAATAIRGGLAIVPGPPFCIAHDGSRNIRLSFATLSATEMPEAVRRLEIAHSLSAGHRAGQLASRLASQVSDIG